MHSSATGLLSCLKHCSNFAWNSFRTNKLAANTWVSYNVFRIKRFGLYRAEIVYIESKFCFCCCCFKLPAGFEFHSQWSMEQRDQIMLNIRPGGPIRSVRNAFYVNQNRPWYLTAHNFVTVLLKANLWIWTWKQMNTYCDLNRESLGSVWKALSMDSTSIITQVNKDEESVAVSPYTQAKREYLLGFHIAHLLAMHRARTYGANFVQSFVCDAGETPPAKEKL